MRQYLKCLVAAAAVAFLAACGGGGSNGGNVCLAPSCGASSSSSSSGGVTSSLALLVSAPTLQTDGSSTVKVRAVAKDSNNGALVGQTITLTASSGTLSKSSGETDETGALVVEFDSNDNKANRTVTLTAVSSGIQATNSIIVQGTSLSFGGDQSAIVGKKVSLTVYLKDAANNGVKSSLNLTSSLGNPVPSSVTTDTTGAATFSYVPTKSGDDVITVSALGASKQVTISTSGVNFEFTSPASGARVNVGSCQKVSVAGSGFTASEVLFAATRGAVSTTSDCALAYVAVQVPMASDGTASAYVISSNAGDATIDATALGSSTPAKASLGIKYVAVIPNSLSLQGSPSTVSVGNSTTLTAVVRDVTGNPVSGATVLFSAPYGGGQVSPVSAKTDDSGVATSSFKADQTLSGKDSVVIVGSVQGTSVSGSAALTVSGLGVNIVIGTDNVVVLVDNPPRYRKVYGASVTDSNGSPIKNQAVTISLLGVEFEKGQLKYGDVPGSTTKRWREVDPITYCPAEDANNNGVIDSGEVGDADKDGRYEPNGAATVMPPSGKGATQVTVTTDANGFVEFWLEYLRNYAYWTEIELKATANVFGKNSVASSVFYLPYPGTELTNENVAPSFAVSPFGVQAGCNTH